MTSDCRGSVHGHHAVKSLVTGGAGFIGSHIVELLVSRGDRVVVIDDLSTGALCNLAAVREDRRLEVVIDSVLNESRVTQLVDDADRVFHLAAAVGVDLIVKQPAKVIETNILGTEYVLRACAASATPVFVASTSEVYGKSDAVPFREESDLVFGPTSKSRWSYACSKAIDEFLALAYAQAQGLPAVIGRYFNTTGPRQTGRYGMVVPRFARQALAGEPITVYGSGEQVRSFAHVADVAPATVDLIECEAARGEAVNLGAPEPVTINALASMVRDLSGSTADIVHVPFEQAYAQGFEDIRVRQPDISKAHALIGFTPKHDLRDIVESVIAWERERLEG